MTNSMEDMRSADLIFVVGSNTTEQHPLAAERIIAAKKQGARLIVADPRRTALAALADIHLPLKPGTDLYVINAMAKCILDAGLHAKEFIRKRTEGFEEFTAALAPWTLERAEEESGIAADVISKAAHWYAHGPDSSLVYCMGVTQHSSGTANCLALANLVMLCGMVGRPNTGLNPLRGQNNVQGACDMGALPDVLTGYLRADSAEGWERFTPVWGDFAATAGLTLTDMIDGAARGGIRSLFIMGENPAVSDPDTAHVLKALSRLDFLVVQDIFLTETAGHAHVVLPAASWLEKEGTFTNTERRVQKVNRVLPPLSGTLPDWEILTRLLRNMGHKAEYGNPEDIFMELRSVTPSYAGMTYARLEKEQGICWPCPAEDHPGTPCLHQDAFARGKGRFAAQFVVNEQERVSNAYPLQLTTGRVGFQYHTGSMTRRIWALEREFPDNFVEMHPDDAKTVGAQDNRMVRVSSQRGSVLARVRINRDIRRGVVFMPFHYSDNPANALTGGRRDPVTKTPAFKASAVRIEEA